MRRFEVYFLQKKVDGAWDTLERAQSVSVLVASLVREFDSREDAEVRILAGSFDESAQDWEFTQIFFVDRSAVELALTERDGDESDEAGPGTAGFAGHDVDDGPAHGHDEPDDSEAVPGGRAFADAIRRASDDGDDLDADDWRPGRRSAYDDLPDGEPPIGPPPRFDAPRRRSGQAFFVIGTIVIALILTGAAVLALGIALDAPQVKPVLSMFRNLTAGVGGDDMVVAKGRGNAVMPETTGHVVTFQGVAAALRGRWSPGHCDETYIEFDEDGLVVGARGRPESLKVPVVETLEDDYTWYVRRSPDLVEHFQKLGKNDIQLVGDTTRAGFSARTSDILTRCP